jgi:ABC-type branched-subunit amino acid transport system ATPase component
VSTDLLVVDDISVTFGGLRALDSVTLRVPERTIVGLIGPNGAGKTTLFNSVSGLVRPVSGRVHLFGEDVTSRSVHQRARAGVGRTFQRLELFGSLSVLENLVVAYEAHHRRGGLLSDLLALPATVDTRAEAEERARAVLELLGIESYADARAGDLPVGLARLVELGRALCTEPKLLILDEPSSGLREAESERLADLLRHARDEDGKSVLVVEHNMRFVLGLCEYIYVLDWGRILAEGPPNKIRADPLVRAAYLGEGIDDHGAAARA